MQTLLAFLVSEINSTALLPQMVSILRARVWKVVMKCKNNTFFSFWSIFLKMYIFEAVTFFSRLMLIRSAQVFSASKVMILMKYFPSSSCCYDNWKIDTFLVPRTQLLRGQIVLSESYILSIQNNVFLKN